MHTYKHPLLSMEDKTTTTTNEWTNERKNDSSTGCLTFCVYVWVSHVDGPHRICMCVWLSKWWKFTECVRLFLSYFVCMCTKSPMVTFELRTYVCVDVCMFGLWSRLCLCEFDLNECHWLVHSMIISATNPLPMESNAAVNTIAHIRVFNLMISLFSGLTIRPVSCEFLFDYLKL